MPTHPRFKRLNVPVTLQILVDEDDPKCLEDLEQAFEGLTLRDTVLVRTDAFLSAESSRDDDGITILANNVHIAVAKVLSEVYPEIDDEEEDVEDDDVPVMNNHV